MRVPSKAGVHGNEWNELVLEATSEALKLASSSMALLLQALLQFATKMGARLVPLLSCFKHHGWIPFPSLLFEAAILNRAILKSLRKYQKQYKNGCGVSIEVYTC